MRLLKQCLLLLTLLIVGPCSLQRAGLCISEGRFLSKDELLERALLQLEQLELRNTMSTLDTGEEKEAIPYASISEFLNANRDCCKVDGPPPHEIGKMGFEVWIRGLDTHIFEATYEVRHKDGTRKKAVFANYQDNCGKFLDFH